MKCLIRDQPVGEYYSNEKKMHLNFKNSTTLVLALCSFAKNSYILEILLA